MNRPATRRPSRTSVCRRASILSGVCLLFVVAVGCPHRSPVWSPEGRRILLLAGEKGEGLDKAASQLWLVDAKSGDKKKLSLPEPNCRFLTATWLNNEHFVALTGKWDEDYIEPGTEKVWRSDGSTWTRMNVPAPSEARATRRLPMVVKTRGGKALVYPTRDEAIVVVALGDGKTLKTLEPAELVGPGPEGGFLVYRPEPSDTGGSEVAAFSSELELLWTRKFSALRAGIAKKLGKKPLEIVFNEASTSHLPHGGEAGDWLGITMVFSDISWREGLTAYYAQLDAKTGKILTAVAAMGTAGKPSAVSKAVWAVLAAAPKKKLPPRLAKIDVRTGKQLEVTPLAGVSQRAVHGYASSPRGDEFAVSVNGAPPSLRIYNTRDLKSSTVIALE